MHFIKNKVKAALAKAQAALEFLTTYGWALVVVLIVISTLAYFGVLSPDMFFPNKCSLPGGVTCLDHEVGSSRITLVLQNNFGETITINNVIAAGISTAACSDNESIILQNKEKAVFTLLGCNNGHIGQKFDGGINVTYTKESGLQHLMQGTLREKISLYDLISSQTVCQNAEDSGLCDGLDIVYGAGYKAACCSEHGLCCS
ncbi:hypothetical protein HYW19_00280 [Candidatus Woesearchaeota archaeon]|nr:hypothetical protein [Candidatus Woesearchaeota archaeon]